MYQGRMRRAAGNVGTLWLLAGLVGCFGNQPSDGFTPGQTTNGGTATGSTHGGTTAGTTVSDTTGATATTTGATTGRTTGTATTTGTTGGSTTSSPVPLSVTITNMGPRSVAINGGIPAAGCLATAVASGTNLQEIWVAGTGWGAPGTSPGVYYTSNGGQNWVPRSTGLTDTSVPMLWLDTAQTSTLVAATFHTGLFQTTDGGQAWRLTGPYGSCTSLLQVGPALYAGCAAGIYKSTDSGATWSHFFSTAEPVRALAASAGRLYAGGDTGTVYAQPVSGTAWTSGTPGAAVNHTGVSILHLAGSPTDPATVLAELGGYYLAQNFLISHDSGATWSPSVTPTNISLGATARGSDGTLWAGADEYLGRSTNEGATWQVINAPNSVPGVAGAWWDERGIYPDFGTGAQNLGLAVDQGLYTSSDGGSTFVSRNGDLTTSIVYSVAISGTTFFTAMQDLGILASFNGGQTWDSAWSTQCGAGEGGAVYANPHVAGEFYWYGGSGLLISHDNLTTCTLSTTINAAGDPTTMHGVAFDVARPNARYIAVAAGNNQSAGIYFSNSTADAFTRQNWPMSAPIGIEVHPVDSNHIYVLNRDGALWSSHDQGATWASAAVGRINNPESWTFTVAASPARPEHVLVASNQQVNNAVGVYVSDDGGRTFAPSNSGLSATFIPRGLAYDTGGSNRVALVGDGSIYVSEDDGATWIDIRRDIRPTVFWGATWNNGALYAGTYGQGVIRFTF